MITKLAFRHFKGFEQYAIEFGRLNLLVGGNNCGKTTIFHALQLVFWCIEQTVDVSPTEATFRKTQVPEIGALPYFSHRDIFYKQQVQDGRRPARIRLELETDSTDPLHFEIYRAFSRNLMIDGSDQKLSREAYDALIRMRPVYIPAAVGITVQEEYLRAVSQQRLISEGRQNQVLRNLVYRLSQDAGLWAQFKRTMTPLFALEGLSVPFDQAVDEWLTAQYAESGCQFDLISAGSGFLQTLNLMCFLFLNESATALLDEPDSHMHDDLQRVVFDALSSLSAQRNLQLIVATHSPTLVDAAGLESVLLIDRLSQSPRVANNVDTLIPLLADQGLSLPPNKVLETLRVRRALFVEGLESDYEEFIALLGEKATPGFRTRTRGLKVFETGGTNRWPYDAIDCFQELLGAQLGYVYISDRDFLDDSEVREREERAVAESRSIVHLARRHRESYLLTPTVIARVLRTRWEAKNNSDVPDELLEARLISFILEVAEKLEDETRTALLVQHEPILRGEASHRSEATQRLNAYFRQAYTEPLRRGEIPYKLLDAKAVLRTLRRHVAEQHALSFSDADICRAFNPEEIPADLRVILDHVVDMFPVSVASHAAGLAPAQAELFGQESRESLGTAGTS